VTASAADNAAPDAPLPDAQQIKDRVFANERKARKDKENYLCEVHEENEEFDSNGSLKKKETRDIEQFFVNGQEISHLLSKDGRPLTGDAARKEQEKVDKEVKKFSDLKQVSKADQEDEKQADMLLRALRYTNGRRNSENGRSVISYDLSGDPNFRPRNLEEKVAQALVGKIRVDEQTGELTDLQVTTDRDIKVFGFVGNLKKGFQFRLIQERQPDGVWIPTYVAGNGTGRALFMSRQVRFLSKTNHCHLYNVDSTSTVADPK
jgi:hypothetical protein